jgi:hypothetical protein
MGKFIFTNGGGLSVVTGPSTTSKANSNLSAFLDAPDPVYGSAGDGSQTLDGSTTVLSMVPSTSVYTATRDLYFYNLTLSASVRLNPGGYRIFVQNILTLGSDATIGYATGFATAGSIQQGGAANNVSLSPVTHSLGGSSALYTVAAPTAATGGANYYYQPFQSVRGYSITGSSTTPTFLRGGAGGALGAGGGVVILAARYITVASGTAYVKAPGTAGSGGGGGGAIIIISSAASLNGSVTTDVTGGTSCNAGTVIYSQVV